MSTFLEKGVTQVYVSTLLELRWGGWVSNYQKKGLPNTSIAPMATRKSRNQLQYFDIDQTSSKLTILYLTRHI